MHATVYWLMRAILWHCLARALNLAVVNPKQLSNGRNIMGIKDRISAFIEDHVLLRQLSWRLNLNQ